MQHYFGAATPLGRQKRDRICEQRSSKNTTTLLSLRLLLASSWLIANCLLQSASGAVVPNGDQLTNELLEKQQNNIGRQQHRQAANDLFEQPEVVEERKQQQELQAQKLVSQGVINGNHATYVEPPADFKPIIYDYEKQQEHQKQRQQQEDKIDTLSGSESSDSPNQLVASIGENSQQQSQPQSQRQSQQTDPLMISSSGSSSEFASSDANRQPQQLQSSSSSSSFSSLPADQFPMKPSIGRWSDWHDMSVEPDLASSDTQQAANFFYAPKQRAAVPQSAPFRIRQQPLAPSWAQVQQPQFQQQQKLSVEQKLEQLAALTVGSGIERTVAGEQQQVKRPGEPAVQQQPQQPDRGIKSVQSGEIASPSGAQDGQVECSPRLALNWPPSSILIKMQQQKQPQQQLNELNQSNQLQAASQPTSGGWQLLAAGKSLQAFNGEQQQAIRKQQQQQQLHYQPQLQRRSKRRRKSKTNAEVRIQQLVAASQHQHQLHQQQLQLQQEQNKQVNGLAGSRQLDQQQQGQQVRQQQHQAEMERWQAKDLHQISADEVSNSTAMRANGDGRRGQVSQRVPGKPAVFIKRFGFVGGLPARSSDGQQGANNNSTSGRRIVKRRRVKTLLPVGLSSWFLGGIRDLDGRHWQLPAEVVSRLAINDVDFSPQPPKVLPPPAGSVVIVGQPEDSAASWQQQQPSAVVPPVQQSNRVPISQLIPR